MTDEEYIEKVRRSWEEEVRFFSNKPKTERWVVREFLERLAISFTDDELISQKEADDVDVIFRDANFQIKELVPEGCRRDAENKAALKRAETAKVPYDLIGPMEARDIILVDAYDFILKWDKKYAPASKKNLDLLVYVTRSYAGLNRQRQPPELASCGWRSISCLYGEQPYVLVAADNAPSFLKMATDSLTQSTPVF